MSPHAPPLPAGLTTSVAGCARRINRGRAWGASRAAVAFAFNLAFAVIWSGQSVTAEPLRVAVAANFLPTADRIAKRFVQDTGIAVSLSSGATGHIFAQITQGAPFDVFLAADQERPARAIAEGLALSGSRRTYAIGLLVLYAPGGGIKSPRDLATPQIRRIAIANPRTAPYGIAAEAVFRHFGIAEAVRDKVVLGQNVQQALNFVVTGNAEAGLVAKSLVLGRPAEHVIALPQVAYPKILQDAVIVATTRQPAAARAFLDYLTGAAGEDIIRSAGYDVASPQRVDG